MKKQTKLKIARIATGVAITASAVGVIMFCGRSSSTHAASQFTHGLKVIGEVFGGGMYRGTTVVAGAGVAASEIVDSVFDQIIPDDVIIKTVNATPPPATTQPVDDEPRFSEYPSMSAFLDAYRDWEIRNAAPEDDIIAQYDAWEEAQRARRATPDNVVSIVDGKPKIDLGYLFDDVDEAI